MSERTINLPDGLQPMSEEDLKTIWNKADDARGEEAHMSNDVFDLVNALDAAYAQIDSLQQQMAERDRTIARLRKALEEARERCAGRGVKTTMLNRQNRKMRILLRDIRSEGVGDKFASKIDIALGE
ncbi:hypothetical protein MKY98_19405 [Paenibacillus sp. FSL M8-0228]|uniref:hypothetical protein n=1 Tax=Paenibacillus sp. FSL M8-0228 TaxID=2921620 RepID=UPI0030F9E92B